MSTSDTNRRPVDRVSVDRIHRGANAGVAERLGVMTYLLDYASQCEAPVGVRADADAIKTDLMVRCRKCPACLDMRRRLWAHRASIEAEAAERSWFGTLTLSPAVQSRLWATVAVSDATPERMYERCVREFAPEVTKYVKRVRKQSQAGIRYMMVAEPHKTWRPHYHMLLHECSGLVTKRILDGQWPHGFTQWRLVAAEETGKVAGYIAKYLAKSVHCRVRSSLHYGSGGSVAWTEEAFGL